MTGRSVRLINALTQTGTWKQSSPRAAPSHVHLALPACEHVHVHVHVCAFAFRTPVHCALRARVRAVGVEKKEAQMVVWRRVGAEGGEGEEKNERRQSVGGGGGGSIGERVWGVSLIARGPSPLFSSKSLKLPAHAAEGRGGVEV